MQNLRLVSSLGAKLFFLTAGLVLVTVTVNSWQSTRLFKKDLERFSEDETILQAREAAQISAALVDNWTLQMGLVMHQLAGLNDAARNLQLAQFLAASPELVAIHLSRRDHSKQISMNYAFTKQTRSVRFDGQDPAAVAVDLRSKTLALMPKTKSEDKDKTKPMILRNLTPVTKLPLLALAMPFTYAGGEEVWATLVVWQNRLSSLLPSSKLISTVFIDSQGKVLSASEKSSLLGGDPLTVSNLLPLARQSDASSGFTTFSDEQGGRWLGAFSKVQGSSTTWVMIRRDARAVEEAAQALIKRTVVWAWVFMLAAVMVSVLGASGLTRNIRDLTAATKQIAGGDFDTKVSASSRDEVGVLAQSIGEMALKIKSLLVSQVAQARLEQEIATAKIVQESFFPKGAANSQALHLAWKSRSASECGGDWWGHFPLDDGRELICIADATGHGAPAALVTAIAYATTTFVAEFNRRYQQGTTRIRVSPSRLLEDLNRILNQALGGQLGMTFFAASFDPSAGQLTYANAGHNFPLYMANTAAAQAEQKIASLNKAMGSPLGFEPVAIYKDKTMQLHAGDRIIFYTDGLIECTSEEQKQWGKINLTKVLKTQLNANVQDMATAVFEKAFEHFGAVPLGDDVTLVVAEINSAWREPTPDLVPGASGSALDVDAT